jgi:hypothetical protein
VRTGLGGVFFLLTVALDRDLYVDFTRPAESGIELDPWRLLAMLGTALLGDGCDEDDEVWALLAALAAPDDPPDAEWTTWVADLADELRAELGELFDCPPEDAGSRLIRRHAAVAVSATTVDVRMSVDELQVEIRLACLDRDPGWVPAAGHAIAFHFD